MTAGPDPFAAQAAHAAASHRVVRLGWTREQWIADAQRLMNDPDGSVLDLVNGGSAVAADGSLPRTVRTLDLFAGAGGLAYGFAQSGLGYEPVFAVEVDSAAARTFTSG